MRLATGAVGRRVNAFVECTRDNPIVRVTSHARSGTHYLLALLKANFYPLHDLSTPPSRTGHWRVRVPSPATTYARLFTTHALLRKVGHRMIYLFRDGRDVCVSLWRTKIFHSRRYRDLTFSEYIRAKLDWYGTPGKSPHSSGRRLTPPQHWLFHVETTRKAWGMDPEILFVRYENLVDEPELTLGSIGRFFGLTWPRYRAVTDRVGPSPGAGPPVGRWRTAFSSPDRDYFRTVVSGDNQHLWPIA
jgi:hypothetical protein